MLRLALAQREEALLALGDNAYNLTYPPIYAMGSSPIDGETVIHTDDDEWLYMPADSWTLENLVQAEQIIRRLINVKEWADLDETQIWMPGLSDIGRQIDQDNELPNLYSEIDGVVDIVRVRTLNDPAGKSVSKIVGLFRKVMKYCLQPLLIFIGRLPTTTRHTHSK